LIATSLAAESLWCYYGAAMEAKRKPTPWKRAFSVHESVFQEVFQAAYLSEGSAFNFSLDNSTKCGVEMASDQTFISQADSLPRIPGHQSVGNGKWTLVGVRDTGLSNR
jgi:hypothetical protein